MQTKSPKYISSKLSTEFPYNTRLAESDSVRIGQDFQCRLGITQKSFMNRSTVSFNSIPVKLRKISKLETFKKELKTWIMKTLEI